MSYCFKEGVYMTCLEAQSMITTFIEEKLDDEQLEEFIHHMRECSDCKEELEVYYTLMVGMKQLDNNEQLSNNFAKELEEQLSYYENRIKGQKRFELQIKFGIICLSTILLMAVLIGLGVMILNGKKRASKENTSKYYYMNVKPHLFYPEDYSLRNPYGGIEIEKEKE